MAAAQDLGVEQRARLRRVIAIEDRAEAGAHVAITDIGHETDAALVHADERHAVAHEIARRGEHRAVAADDHGEVGLLAQCRVVEPAAAELFGGFFLDQGGAAALFEKSGKLGDRCGDFRSAELADQCNTTKARCHSVVLATGGIEASVQ